MAGEFGRDAFRVTYAAEARHVVGKPDADVGLSLAEIVVGPLMPGAGGARR